jgi:hypothetical protein
MNFRSKPRCASRNLKRLRKKKQVLQKIEMLCLSQKRMIELRDLKKLQERDLRLQQMKETTKRLISNETSQDRSIKFKDAANRFAPKISNETLKSNERKQDFKMEIINFEIILLLIGD